MAVVPELCALSPPHPSEDRLRRRRPPGRLQLSRDEDGLPEGRRDTVHKRPASLWQVDFLAQTRHIIAIQCCWASQASAQFWSLSVGGARLWPPGAQSPPEPLAESEHPTDLNTDLESHH